LAAQVAGAGPTLNRAVAVAGPVASGVTLRVAMGLRPNCRRFPARREKQRIAVQLIAPCRPRQNGQIESLNGRFRNECPNAHVFLSLEEMRAIGGLQTRLQSGPSAQRAGRPMEPPLPDFLQKPSQEVFGLFSCLQKYVSM
jgi:hypothetical protein